MSLLQIPRWFIVTVGLVSGIVATTWAVSNKFADTDTRMAVLKAETQSQADMLNIRFCRIEYALKIDPWPTCPR